MAQFRSFPACSLSMLPYPQFMMFLRPQPADVGRMSLGGAKCSSIMTAPLLQARNITQNHIRRMREAEETWKGYAEEIKAGNRKSFLELMEERGLVNQVVGDRDALNKMWTERRVGVYVGVDPTAPSLHIGHMLPFMVLAWAYVHGIRSVFLLGGSTSQIGDPTDREAPRAKQARITRKENMVNMHLQLRIFGMSIERYGAKHGYAYEPIWRRAIVNNNAWWLKAPFMEVMKTMGESVRLGPMLGRDTVKNRLQSGKGMSLAEFTYPLLQAWDWWQLIQQQNILVQVGGSDQAGNIQFGIDATKALMKADQDYWRKHAPNPEDREILEPMGFTTPLLTTPSGEKFGKTAGNAVWLDKDMTPTFDLYQFFIRVPDENVEQYLKYFTFLSIPTIKKIMVQHMEDPSKRVAQHKLASEFVELMRGPAEAAQAEKDHRSLFGSLFGGQVSTALEMEARPKRDINLSETSPFRVPSPHVTLPRSLVVGQFFHKVLWSAGLASSKAEAMRLILQNGAAVASRSDSKAVMDDKLSYVPIKTWNKDETAKFIIDDSLLILRIGKWKVKIVKIVSDEDYEKLGLQAPGWREEEEEAEVKSGDVRVE
ncbi:tyrosine-tRNA ligase [Paracoccidioides brasiliensis Pb18]|uniref:Tyrosine--tRNA ligase n=1 Tax=Paracoccidioides brasiliensis (strain Pb18) TaxID=502780 RepID=C1G7A5_PARBD|nr:tyrosine-tRNA ligase [Paracoccidioides brasiliensis Pb18]EEH46962.2 tyrosine-tRNA ligase [Paracoccidioides brasiliensis Pb18]